jgi:hypothetical protein
MPQHAAGADDEVVHPRRDGVDSGVRMKTPKGLSASGTRQTPFPACVRCTSHPQPLMMT